MAARRRASQWTCLAAALIALHTCCAAQPQRDLQLWPELHVTAKIKSKLVATSYFSIRFNDNVARMYEQQYGAGVAYIPSHYITFSPWYRYIRSQPTTARATHENRFAADIFMRTPALHRLVFSNRSRGEFRFIDGILSERYRNRVQLEAELEHAQYKFTPYLSWEPFYDTRFHAWSQARYYVGARVPVRPRIWLEPYYVYRDDHRSLPHYTNAIYLAMNVSLR